MGVCARLPRIGGAVVKGSGVVVTSVDGTYRLSERWSRKCRSACILSHKIGYGFLPSFIVHVFPKLLPSILNVR